MQILVLLVILGGKYWIFWQKFFKPYWQTAVKYHQKYDILLIFVLVRRII